MGGYNHKPVIPRKGLLANLAEAVAVANEMFWTTDTKQLFVEQGGAKCRVSDPRPKIGTFTRDLTADSGDVAYTEIGFQPSAILFMAHDVSAGMSPDVSFGMDDGTNFGCLYQSPGAIGANWGNPNAGSIFLRQAAGVQYALVASFDEDGFTLTWTKSGSPTGTARIYYMAFRP